MGSLMIKQAIRFVIVGIINTLNYYLIYLLFQSALSIHYLTAHILAFLISMVGSFFMNSYFTYKIKPTLKKFFQFPLTYLVNIIVTTSAIYLLVDIMGLNEKISPLLASFLAIPFTFIASRIILTNKA